MKKLVVFQHMKERWCGHKCRDQHATGIGHLTPFTDNQFYTQPLMSISTMPWGLWVRVKNTVFTVNWNFKP